MRRLVLFVLSCLCVAGAHAEPVRLVFAGDIMLDDGPGRVVAAGRDPFEHFAGVLAEADFRIGNLETPVAATGKALENKIAVFRASPAVVSVLKPHFDALSVANNHSGDYGKAAFVETLAHVARAGIRYFGGGRNLAEAHAPLWIDRKGLRIAVLGYNEFKPRSFEAGPGSPGVAWSEDDQVIDDIRAARRAGADLVIPFMHWGWERETEPCERQRVLARRMIDAGADLVIGGHPHVTQGAEYYRGRPIVYSLGNFVFDGFDYQEARRGWMLRLTVDRNGVVAWDTLAAQMDDDGVPHPVAGAKTPCGDRTDALAGRVRVCANP